MDGLVSVGTAVLRVVGLNPQRLGTTSEARVPGIATWDGMDYQATGLGEEHVRLEAVTYPHVIGGIDSLVRIIQHHRNQDVVNFIRLGENFLGTVLGQVRIRNLFVDETHLHPITHVGRKVGVEVDLVFVSRPDRPGSSDSGLTSA